MDAMRADMGGAACTLSAVYTAAKLRIPINIIGKLLLPRHSPGGVLFLCHPPGGATPFWGITSP